MKGYNDYVIIRSEKKETIDMVKNFVKYIVDDETVVLSDNICKEYWIEEFNNRYGNEVTRKAKANSKTEREILEEQFNIFESSGGWENTEGFDEWTNDYTPEDLLNKW